MQVYSGLAKSFSAWPSASTPRHQCICQHIKKESSCIQDRKSEITLRQQKQQEDLHSLRDIIIHDTALIRLKW